MPTNSFSISSKDLPLNDDIIVIKLEIPSLLARPIIRSAMEAVAVNVIMPLNNFGIFKYLLSTPVIIPHIAPDKTAAIVAIKGLTPIEMSVPQIAAPIKKLPSFCLMDHLLDERL